MCCVCPYLVTWFNIKIKEEWKLSQCVETNYVILLQCNDREHHLACSTPTLERSEHISIHLVPPLVFFGRIQQGGLDPTRDHQIIRVGEITLVQSHWPCSIHVKINYETIIDHEGHSLKIHYVTEYWVYAKRKKTIHMHVRMLTLKHDLLQRGGHWH